MRNIIVSVVALCLLMTGCNSRTPQYRIGVSQCLDDAWRQKMNYEMERELLLHPDMTLSRRIAYGSNELQCAQIDSFIKERVDLLIVSPNEAKQVQPAVTRAYRAGIPVIVADRRVPGDEWTAFIGGDNYKVGRLMAQWVIGKASDKESKAKGKPFVVLEVAGLPGSTPATLRHKGMMEGIEAADTKGRIVVESVMGRWYKENAYEVVSAYLETHPLPDVIVAHNDLMAIGAAEAVPSIPIMGVDGIHLGLQAIVDGKIECSATYSSRGDMVIDAAARILHKEPYVRDTVLETSLVDITAAYPMLKQDEELDVVATMLLGEPTVPGKLIAEDPEKTRRICRELIARYELDMLILTCGAIGSYVFTASKESYVATPKVQVADTVGAGDSFTATFVAQLLLGKTIREAHEKAVAVSAYVCTQRGAMPLLPAELKA